LKGIFKKFYSLEYESQVLALICTIGLGRILVELISDYIEKNRLVVVAINFSIFLLILSLLYTAFKRNFKKVHSIYGLLLTILLILLIVLFGGMHGYAKFNYFSSLYFIIMIYTGRTSKTLLSINILLLLTVLAIGVISPPWLSIIDFGSSYSKLDFWFTLITLSSFSLYLKWITISQGRKLSSLNRKMANQVKQESKLGLMLQGVNSELRQTQKYLESEVNARTQILTAKNNSIESFVTLNTTELINVVDDLLLSMKSIKSNSQYSDSLKMSSDELAAVVESIRKSLKENGLLDRNVIRGNERNI
jgi:hypothetical protein